MEEKIKIGVIGVGQIGQVHLDNYRSLPAAEVVAIADADPERARAVGEKYGIGQVYGDFRELLRREEVQAVDICLHNNLHMPVSVAALEAGKHVYCEKPMAGSYRDAEKMFQSAQALGLKLSIQLATLFSWETKAARALIDQGWPGKIYHARSVGFRRRGRPYVDGYGSPPFVQKKNAGGGALYDMGVYHLASMLYLLGNPAVERVSGRTYQETGMDEPRREASGYDVEELGLGFVRLAGGVTLDIFEAWAIHLGGMDGSVLLGSRGGIRLEPFGCFQSLGDLNVDGSVDLGAFAQRTRDLRAAGDPGETPQQHWVAALQGRAPLLPTAELALNTMLISEAIYLSDRLGREVTGEETAKASQSTALPA
ncbi:MAG TPA: Gfo/Idh/MocA family oxidoreductase [Anaerolineales bacterium]|nr:Gfo/Idh/MocA family oxidoreductase [Anaerolineales bacterium]